jgi:hypothetical protein
MGGGGAMSFFVQARPYRNRSAKVNFIILEEVCKIKGKKACGKPGLKNPKPRPFRTGGSPWQVNANLNFSNNTAGVGKSSLHHSLGTHFYKPLTSFYTLMYRKETAGRYF